MQERHQHSSEVQSHGKLRYQATVRHAVSLRVRQFPAEGNPPSGLDSPKCQKRLQQSIDI